MTDDTEPTPEEEAASLAEMELEENQEELVAQVIAAWRLSFWLGGGVTSKEEWLSDIIWNGWQGLSDMDRPGLIREYVDRFLRLSGHEDAHAEVHKHAATDASLTEYDWSRAEVWEFIVADASLRLPEFKP